MEGTTKLKVHTNGGKEIEIITNDYDPIFLNEQLNNNNTVTLVIGDYIFSRINVKQVVPVKEEPKEPEQPPVTEPEKPTELPTEETNEGDTTVSQSAPTEQL